MRFMYKHKIKEGPIVQMVNQAAAQGIITDSMSRNMIEVGRMAYGEIQVPTSPSIFKTDAYFKILKLAQTVLKYLNEDLNTKSQEDFDEFLGFEPSEQSVEPIVEINKNVKLPPITKQNLTPYDEVVRTSLERAKATANKSNKAEVILDPLESFESRSKSLQHRHPDMSEMTSSCNVVVEILLSLPSNSSTPPVIMQMFQQQTGEKFFNRTRMSLQRFCRAYPSIFDIKGEEISIKQEQEEQL
ncbi:hypothetical protein AKO1_011645 [Acrasis kona]|uniref:Uncharacterized protein n=1 Tax=Acrasis kona TaxID=1008807 RepID=A0AAW2Z6G2_9EUKA